MTIFKGRFGGKTGTIYLIYRVFETEN